jgi:hypothetical protein
LSAEVTALLQKSLALFFFTAVAAAQPTVVRTTTLIDGTGQVLKNQEIVIETAESRASPTPKRSPPAIVPPARVPSST